MIVDDDPVDVAKEVQELCFEGSKWAVCSLNEGRRPETHGPIRQVVETAFTIVSSHVALAVYVANQFFLTGHARAPIVIDSAPEDENLLFVGRSQQLRALLDNATGLEIDDASFALDDCEWSAPTHALLALVPLGESRLGLVLIANSDAALVDAVEILATPTIPPMARQPFSTALSSKVL